VRRRGEHNTALTLFEKAAAENSDDPSARIEIADVLVDLGRYDEAEAIFSTVLERSPRHFWALMGLGRLYRKRGDRSTALTCFDQASAADPRQDAAIIEIAATLSDLGRVNQARRVVDALISKAPGHFSALMHRGYIERRSGAEEAALPTFLEAHARTPRDPQPFVDVALSHRTLGDPDAVERRLHEALLIDPQHLGALFALTDHALEAEEFGQAITLSERAITAHLKISHPISSIAVCSLPQGR
jgi:tetratricopeptide (TPR) repeat protein